jgi:putative FmdB family regulatory protein
MPTYEYECRFCGTHFERVQSFTDPSTAECPNGHRDVHRVLSAPAIIFNGPGFYITDSRKSGHGNESKDKEGSTAAPKCSTCSIKPITG